MIKILRQGLPIQGHIKVGMSGGKTQGGKQRPPVKFDHFEITSNERDSSGARIPDIEQMIALLRQQDHPVPTCGGCKRSEALMKKYDHYPNIDLLAAGLPTSIPVMLIHNEVEQAFPNKLAWYRGSVLYCTGDGERATRRERRDGPDFGRMMAWTDPDSANAHPDATLQNVCGNGCPAFGEQCKPNARLYVVLGGAAKVGGCYAFTTTSWASTANIQHGLDLVASITGGAIAWIPLNLSAEVTPVKRKDGGSAGKAMIARIDYDGTPAQLIGHAQQLTAMQIGLGKDRQAIATGSYLDTPADVLAFREEYDHEGLAKELSAGESVAASTSEEVTQAESTGVAGSSGSPAAAEDNPFDLEPLGAREGGLEEQPPTEREAAPSRPEVDSAEATQRTDPRSFLSHDHKNELWQACKLRAAECNMKDAGAILLAVLQSMGESRSATCPDDYFDDLMSLVDRWVPA